MGRRKGRQQSESEDSASEHSNNSGEGPNPAALQQLARMMDANYSENLVNALPASVRDRVRALQGQQKDIGKLREQFAAERRAIENQYQERLKPLLEKQNAIIEGSSAPTKEEIALGKAHLEKKEEGEEGKKEKEAEEKEKKDGAEAGIPEFWLTVLKHHLDVRDLIEQRDEECLKFLTRISSKSLEEPEGGFTLEFHFAENPFFTEKVLTKTYHLLEEDELILDKAIGCDITWKAGKNLTVVQKKKKAKARGGATKTITKEEPCPSFFNFFKPPSPEKGDDEDEEDEDEDLEEMMEEDFEIGRVIRQVILPKAILWYTGEAVPEGMDDDEDEDEDEDESESEPEPEPRKKGGGGRGGGGGGGKGNSGGGGGGGKGGRGGRGGGGGAGGEQPECKQQ